MMDKNQLKVEGLAFGRSLQRAFRSVLLYSFEHAAAEGPLQQAYNSLNSLLKLTPQFTFGFFNQRVLLNEILTPDSSLSALQTEFFKRSIAAVTFFLGITFREFKRGLGLLATKPEVIEQAGGFGPFFRKNPVEGMRIVAEEDQIIPTGDTVRGMDLQSYRVAQAVLEARPETRMPGLEMLLQTAGMEKPAGFSGTAGEVLELAGKAAQAAWTDPQRNPKEIIPALARLLEELTPDYLIAALPGGRQSEFRGRPPHEIATELAEDVAVDWAVKRLSASQAESGGRAAEEEVVRVLERTLKTTQVEDRLLQKLGRLVKEANLPEEVNDRIRQGLVWPSLSQAERHAYLMGLERFTEREFQHLIEYIEEAGKGGDGDKATQVAEHYLAWLDSSPVAIRTEGLAWLPQLLRVLTGLHSLTFVRTVAERLCRELLDEKPPDWKCHREVADCLASAAQATAMFEDFETAVKIGLDLERSLERDSAHHADCCGNALQNLLPSASVERLIEMSLQKSIDPGSARAIASLLRLAGMQAAEIVLQILEGETVASKRLRLLRVAGQLGPSALTAARKRLRDERWYVVRNACSILGALNDPELAAELEPAFHHPDDRVQQAAVTTLIRTKVSGRGDALAKAFPHLQPHLQETVLNELILMKDPAAIHPIGEFILQGSASKAWILEQATQVLAAIPDERAVEALGKILYDGKQPLSLRRVALAALKSSSVPLARQRLAEFSHRAPADPLAEEYRKASTPKAG